MEEDFLHPSHIPPEILSLPAKDVLNFVHVKGTLSLQLNMRGALKNWEDVASSLGYSTEQILGHFAHDVKPGWLVLRDWIYKRNGLLGQIVDVFADLKLNACLELIQEDVQEYESQKTLDKKPAEDKEAFNSMNVEALEENSSSTDLQGIPEEKENVTDVSVSVKSNCDMSDMASDHTSRQQMPLSLDYPPVSGSQEPRKLSSSKNICDSNAIDSQKQASPEKKPEFLRTQSWSVSRVETPTMGPQYLRSSKGKSSFFRRSRSHPNEKEMSQNTDSIELSAESGAKKKKKSFRSKFKLSLFKKPKPDKNTGALHHKNMVDSTKKVSTPETLSSVVTASSSYSEPASIPRDNLSPLAVESDDRKTSLTDSLSSAGSLPSPTSPGCESGYVSSDGPLVSPWKNISIIHCFDMEETGFRMEVMKLYKSFSSLGYDCHLDKLEILKISENKFRYAVKQVKHSDFLFICVSPELKMIFDSPPEDISDCLEDDSNTVLRLESDLILGDLAEHAVNRNGRFMTVILKGACKDDVPFFLTSYLRYKWPEDEKKMRRTIEGQNEFTAAPVSVTRNDPPSLVIRPAQVL